MCVQVLGAPTLSSISLFKYLTALHIAIVNPSAGFELVKWLREGSFVVRFLAGMCRHFVYRTLCTRSWCIKPLGLYSWSIVHCPNYALIKRHQKFVLSAIP